MAHSNYLRQMARLMRVEQQMTVDQLALRLALPRSTVYYWVRDLPLRSGADVGSGGGPGVAVVRGAGPAADAQAAEPARSGRVAAKAGGAPRKRKRLRPSSESAYEDALRSFDDLAAQPTFRDFVCLCIVRGCTREQTRFLLSDSDPAVMRLVDRWLLRLSEESPLRSLRYEPGQSLTELRRFWAGVIGVEARTIRAEGEPNAIGAHDPGRSPRYGVLTVVVEDTLLRARLQAWICRTRESWR